MQTSFAPGQVKSAVVPVLDTLAPLISSKLVKDEVDSLKEQVKIILYEITVLRTLVQDAAKLRGIGLVQADVLSAARRHPRRSGHTERTTAQPCAYEHESAQLHLTDCFLVETD